VPSVSPIFGKIQIFAPAENSSCGSTPWSFTDPALLFETFARSSDIKCCHEGTGRFPPRTDRENLCLGRSQPLADLHRKSAERPL